MIRVVLFWMTNHKIEIFPHLISIDETTVYFVDHHVCISFYDLSSTYSDAPTWVNSSRMDVKETKKATNRMIL